jgi:hypothetical protein
MKPIYWVFVAIAAFLFLKSGTTTGVAISGVNGSSVSSGNTVYGAGTNGVTNVLTNSNFDKMISNLSDNIFG